MQKQRTNRQRPLELMIRMFHIILKSVTRENFIDTLLRLRHRRHHRRVTIIASNRMHQTLVKRPFEAMRHLAATTHRLSLGRCLQSQHFGFLFGRQWLQVPLEKLCGVLRIEHARCVSRSPHDPFHAGPQTRSILLMRKICAGREKFRS